MHIKTILSTSPIKYFVTYEVLYRVCLRFSFVVVVFAFEYNCQFQDFQSFQLLI